MKKLFFVFTLIICSWLGSTAKAQVSFRVNISSQPIWGPVGYDHVEYYYLPEIEAYYYVPRHRYVYLEGDRWVSRSYLPPRYRDYDLYHGRKVVINEPHPYWRHHEYRERYARHEEYREQPIRDSHEGRYFENRHHPEHARWKEYKREQKRNGHDNGRHEGQQEYKHEGHDNGRHGR